MSRLKQIFAIDLRTLALFRICLALLIIGDIFFRFPDLEAHFTDMGVFPRLAVLQFGMPYHFSFHMLSGIYSWQVLLSIIQLIFAIFLLIGLRTRLSTFISWIFICSIQGRNEIIIGGGDILLRLLAFWSMFLPLNAKYSLDNACSSEDQENEYVSFSTAAILLQVLMIYVFTVLLKDSDIWRKDFSAVYYALNIDIMNTHFGRYLLQFPLLLKWGTILTLIFEFFGAVLAFSPFWTSKFRLIIVPLFWIFHMGLIGSTLHVGTFIWSTTLAWMLFIPSDFWDYLGERRKHLNIKIFYDGECSFCYKMVQVLKTFLFMKSIVDEKAQETSEMHVIMNRENSWILQTHTGQIKTHYDALAYFISVSPFSAFRYLFTNPVSFRLGEFLYRQVASNRQKFSKLFKWVPNTEINYKNSKITELLALLTIILVFAWNLSSLNSLNSLGFTKYLPASLVNSLYLDQHWGLFAPYPYTDDGYYVMPGYLSNGEMQNIVRWDDPQELTFDKPKHVNGTFINIRWLRYMRNFWFKQYGNMRGYFGQYICYYWNVKHKERVPLQSFRVFYMKEETPPPGGEFKIERNFLWEHICQY